MNVARVEMFRVVEPRKAPWTYHIEAKGWVGLSYGWHYVEYAYTLWGAKRRIKRLAKEAAIAQSPVEILHEVTI